MFETRTCWINYGSCIQWNIIQQWKRFKWFMQRTTWMDFKGIVLSEICQMSGLHTVWVHVQDILEKVKLHGEDRLDPSGVEWISAIREQNCSVLIFVMVPQIYTWVKNCNALHNNFCVLTFQKSNKKQSAWLCLLRTSKIYPCDCGIPGIPMRKVITVLFLKKNSLMQLLGLQRSEII